MKVSELLLSLSQD